MRPRAVRRVDSDNSLALYPTEAPTPPASATAPLPAARGSRSAIRVDPSWIVPLVIAIVSALSAFTVVRWRAVPARAASAPTATLTVDTRPPAAEVSIDGQHRGVTPLTLLLGAGTHTLTLRNRDAERIVPLTVAAGQQVAQYFELAPAALPEATARLSVTTDPPGARVSVDGRLRGVSPLVIADLSAAEHRVTVTSSGGSVDRRIALEAGTTKELVFALPRTSAPVGGWLSVTAPFPVDVLENGELLGASGSTKVMLPAGRHDLVLRNATLGYESPRSVDVAAGGVAAVQVVAPTAPLSINAVPWAEVEIDGTSYGPTPIGNVMIPIGPHEITFRHPQYDARVRRIVVSAQGVNRVALDFTR